MPLWRLLPVADPDDSRWLDHPVWREVLVRAPSAAFARQAAGALERDLEAAPAGNECPSFKSAFEDEKLYQVIRLTPDQAKAAGGDTGAKQVLRADKLRDARTTRGEPDPPTARKEPRS